mgnify:CR=1 FL=1
MLIALLLTGCLVGIFLIIALPTRLLARLRRTARKVGGSVASAVMRPVLIAARRKHRAEIQEIQKRHAAELQDATAHGAAAAVGAAVAELLDHMSSREDEHAARFLELQRRLLERAGAGQPDAVATPSSSVCPQQLGWRPFSGIRKLLPWRANTSVESHRS